MESEEVQVGPVESKSEMRGPKPKRNPKIEIRIHGHYRARAGRWIEASSDLGFRSSFESRVSAIGLQGWRKAAE